MPIMQIFQMYTGHYHTSKGERGRWQLPSDDSHMISRTLVTEANEWTTITAIHKVGDDWTYDGEIHYHLRFRVVHLAPSFYLDDVRVSKIGSSSNNSTDVRLLCQFQL